jgi:hypothetical protein
MGKIKIQIWVGLYMNWAENWDIKVVVETKYPNEGDSLSGYSAM